MLLSRAAVLLVARCLSWLLLSSSSCTRAFVWPGAVSAAPRSICMHPKILVLWLIAQQRHFTSFGCMHSNSLTACDITGICSLYLTSPYSSWARSGRSWVSHAGVLGRSACHLMNYHARRAPDCRWRLGRGLSALTRTTAALGSPPSTSATGRLYARGKHSIERKSPELHASSISVTSEESWHRLVQLSCWKCTANEAGWSSRAMHRCAV